MYIIYILGLPKATNVVYYIDHVLLTRTIITLNYYGPKETLRRSNQNLLHKKLRETVGETFYQYG